KLMGMNQEFVGECRVKYGWKAQRTVGDYFYTFGANAHPHDDLKRQYSIGMALQFHGRKSVEELQIVEDGRHQASCPLRVQIPGMDSSSWSDNASWWTNRTTNSSSLRPSRRHFWYSSVFERPTPSNRSPW